MVLAEAVRNSLNIELTAGMPRHLLDGWFFQGESSTKCSECSTTYKIFRCPYSTSKGEYKYWAVVCDECETASTLDDISEASKKALTKWDKGDVQNKPKGNSEQKPTPAALEKPSKPEPINTTKKKSESGFAPIDDLQIGDEVEHSSFGKGVIFNLHGTGESVDATIGFYGGGVRVFALAYAPLKRVNSQPKIASNNFKSAKYSTTQIKDTIQMLKELIATIQEKHLISHSNFGGYELPSDISKPDLIAYTKKYGFKHLQELRIALREVFVGTGKAAPPTSSVDVLDIGCGPGMSRTMLREFGISVKTYSGVDYAESCLWLANELNSDLSSCSEPSVEGQFVLSLDEIKPAEVVGFVIMNHVLNQPFVNELKLTSWAKNLNRIYPYGFFLLNVEPRYDPYEKKSQLFEGMLLIENITILNSLSFVVPGEFKGQKTVSWWVCGRS